MIKQFLNLISNIGIDENQISLEEKHSIRLVNQISFFLILVTTLGDIGEISVIGWQLILHTLLLKMLFIIVLYLNYKRKNNFAAIVFSWVLILELCSVPFLVSHSLNADGLFLSIIVLIGAVLRKTNTILFFAALDLCILISWHIADSYSLLHPINIFKNDEILFIEISYSIIMMASLLVGLLSFKRSAKEFQQGLTQNITEKDILIKEIHHRVKNNLQIMISMLSLEKNNLKTKESIDLLHNITNRVVSMSLIHNKLYQKNYFNGIDIKEYVLELVSLLTNMSVNSKFVIKKRIEIENYQIRLEIGIPLGLIITELVSNSLKHGLNKKGSDCIEIIGIKINNTYSISIKDNGKGINEKEPLIENMGFLLINILSKQINALIKRENKNGLITTISFKI